MSAQGSGSDSEFAGSLFSRTNLTADPLVRLKTRVSRARSLYDDGKFLESLQEASDVSRELESQPAQSASAARLMASACVLEGRALLRMGHDQEAVARCAVAVAQFDRWPAEDDKRTPTAEELTDLGIALHVAGGQDPRARDVLTAAVAHGAADAETHRFLGLTFVRLNAIAEADRELTESLRIEPRHIATLQALVRCREQLSSSPENMAALYFELAGALYGAQRLHEALEACRRSVDLFPTSSGEAGLGSIKAELGLHEEALDAFERASILDPDDPGIMFRKGEVLRLLSRFAEAVPVLQRVPDSASEHVHALGSLGAALRGLDRRVEALQVLDRALALEPGYVFALTQKAELLLGAGRADDAIEAYKQAASAAPSALPIQLRLAEVLSGHERYQEALAVSEATLKDHPEEIGAWAMKAASLYGLGQFAPALEAVDQVLTQQPDHPVGHLIKGEVLRKLHRLEEAVDEFARALKSRPDMDATRFDRAESLRLIGRYDESLAELDELLNRNADNAMALATKGQILAARGSREEAVTLLQRALTLDPSMAWAHLTLGQNLQTIHRSAEALVALDTVLALSPDNVVALGWKGDALLELARYDEAIAALDRALAVDAQDVFSMATKGQVLIAEGKSQDGLDLLSRAVEIDETSSQAKKTSLTAPWAQFTLAEGLRVAGRAEESLVLYDKILAREPQRTDVLGGKGTALMALERYEEAMRWLNTAIASEPRYDFGVAAKAALLLECGEFETSVVVLAPVTASDSASAWALMIQGFGLRLLGRYAEAELVLRRSVDIEPDATARQLLADVYSFLGQKDKGNALYQGIVDGTSGELDPDKLAILGWCRFRLEEFDTAVQCLVDAVSRGRKMAHAQLDLSLTLLSSHREDLAVREYERGIEMAVRDHHPWRQRGLFRVALQDIRNARDQYAHVADSPRTDEISRRLQKELDRLPPVILAAADDVASEAVSPKEATR